MEQADLSRADARKAVFDGANLAEARLFGTDLSEAYLRGTHLQNARLDKAKLLAAPQYGHYLDTVRPHLRVRAEMGPIAPKPH